MAETDFEILPLSLKDVRLIKSPLYADDRG